ncbi:MAG: MarR family winged helix-turn-helix transcriptional regulator [Pseudonocardia sp.]
MSARLAGPPIGLQLTGAARAVHRAFDDALGAAGGSLPTWRVLMSLKGRPVANQRELAAAVGIQGATLTHHLNAMESAGLLTRRRDPANRRVHLVELTELGEAAFARMREAAVAFDRRLRTGLDADEVDRLSRLLGRLRANVTRSGSAPSPPDTEIDEEAAS